ncbi:MAG TPA: ABC transporter permease [Tepidisphaeraceae bacterium]|jgi:ABC-type dipeptide/oligopeptide/nickel transport system permease component
MLNYIIRRLLLMFPTVIGITLLVFAVMFYSPGGVGGSLLDNAGDMRPEDRKAREAYLEQRFGINRPFFVQYGKWLNNVSPVGLKEAGGGFPRSAGFGFKWPDLGRSFVRERQVTSMIADALPTTLALNLITVPVIYTIAVTAGLFTATRRGRFADVSLGVVFIGLWSLPVMWMGVMLIGFLANRDFLALFPTGGLTSAEAYAWSFFPGDGHKGWLLDRLWHLAGPVICLTYGGFAFLSKLTRASVLENMTADYVRTARSKGLNERVILYRHVLRNSILPLITVASGIIPGLLGGSVIVESIFSLDGMGKVTLDAITVRDREVVLSMTLVSAIIGTTCLLISDVCYVLADPRVSYD